MTGDIQVDGRLDEAAWATATPVSDFTQVDPEEGQPVSEATEARVLFDNEAIYIGVRLHDRQPVSERLGRRDMDLLDSDWLGVVIDSYHDHRTAFFFDLNPAGVQRDAVKSMGAGGREQDDLSWDPVWEGRATKDEGGWTAEYRIPFSQLRFGREEEPTWGIQLERRHRAAPGVRGPRFHTQEPSRAASPPTAIWWDSGGWSRANDWKCFPTWSLGRSMWIPGRILSANNSEHFASGGVDLLYRVTSDFALNATLNPDFGQVEVDPAVINLTVYETFFQEKRPFFIEGSEIFDFGRNTSGGRLFYSRRIGRKPQVRPPTSAADMPEATTILGAGEGHGKDRRRLVCRDHWRPSHRKNPPGTWTGTGAQPKCHRANPSPTTSWDGSAGTGETGRPPSGRMVTATNRDLGTDLLQADPPREWLRRGHRLPARMVEPELGASGEVLVGSRVAGDPRSIVAVQRYGNHFFQRPDADHLEVDSSTPPR